MVSSLQWNSGVWKAHLTHAPPPPLFFFSSDASWLSKIPPKDFEELAGTGAWQI